ncbi:glycosyltransferase family 4 protein [Listeria aquatica]|uniref:glycosyltransferase family 4 protein n=1 Tax=Listeria aquatica TaxID=1494960 RepID=UPI0031F52E59
MNILYLHQYFATLSSSTSIRSFVFTKRLVESGHKVTVITTDAFMKQEQPYKIVEDVKYYNIRGIEILAIDSCYSNFLNKKERIKEFLEFMKKSESIGGKLSGIDLIFATSTPLTIGIPAMKLSKKLDAPFVFEVRDLWPEAPIQMGYINFKPLQHFLRLIEKRIYKKAEHIVCLSPGMADGVRSRGITEEKVTVIPNLADLELFSEENIDQEFKQEIVEEFGLKDKFIVTHIGAMGEANGLHYLLNAAEHIQNRGTQEIKFLIVGSGKTKPSLVAESKRRNLQNIIFIDSIEKSDVPTYLDLANITITSFLPKPILATNSPNKFFDALAAGKPIIVNSNGWTKNIVEEQEIGYYVDAEKPEQLAKLLIELKDKKEYLKSLKEKIKNLAKMQYSADGAVANLTKIFGRVTKEWSGKR